MTVYTLADRITAVQTAANIGLGPNPIVQAVAAGGGPPSTQAFQLVVTGSGAVSATAQPIGSNDGVNFTNYGSTITATSAPSVSTGAVQGATPFLWLGAIVTAISGTGAKATVTMSA